MSIKFQNEAESWQKDKYRYLSGEWKLETLVAVSIWRCWNNIDIATRPRGSSSRAGGGRPQKETWRTFVAAKVSEGGLDQLDLAVANKVGLWLQDMGLEFRPERDESGGEHSVAYFGATITVRQRNGQLVRLRRLPMPAALRRKKTA